MAACVCYRLCCRQIFQQISRSFKTVPQVSNPAVLNTNTATPLFKVCQSARFYHAVHSNSGLWKTVKGSRRILWRGFKSQQRGNVVVKPNSPSERSSLLRPFGFTVFVCGSSFVGCMIWQYEAARTRAEAVMKRLNRQFGQMFEPTYQKEMGFRAHINAMWNSFSDGQKLIAGIIGLNFFVFLCWKSPALQPAMMRYFTSLPGNPSISMLLSAFSHLNLWHIAANMYVLWSFSSISVSLFGREQWLAVYLSSATLSAFASLANKVLRRGPMAPSLGASGAIMCLLGAVCVTNPDARLSIAFIGEIYPHSFSASSALKFLLLLDTTGLVLGWRLFDHAAHLGGVLFGIWYATYGHKMVWGHREKVMQYWHKVRGKPDQ